MALNLFYFSSCFPVFFCQKGTRNCRCCEIIHCSYNPPLVSASSPPWPGFNENPPVWNLEEVMNQLVELRHEAIHDHW